VEIFSEVKTGLEALMARAKFDGLWNQTYWTHRMLGKIPFAIVKDEAKIIELARKRYPAAKFNNLDSLFELIGIHHWGYNTEFEICSSCGKVFSLDPEDNDYSIDPATNKQTCNDCTQKDNYVKVLSS
jgi:hypothetical protein